MRKMDKDNTAMKEQLKKCQEKKAQLISKRLKKEVLVLYGDS